MSLQPNASVLILVPLIAGTAALAYWLGGKVRRPRGVQSFETVVRCREGHLFRTVWIPMVSLKAIRFGWFRYQYCPVGRHWTMVTPVDPGDLTPAERLEARRNEDSGVP